MYRILRNSFLGSRTGLKTTVTFEEEEHQPSSDSSTPESILTERMIRESVQQALAELPVPFREIVLLCEVEEMSYQEISETLAIPMGTVMSRLSRARKSLRNLLRQNSEGGRHGV
jgi:RNA polymerase sigma-70 factor (ECF subfamily)